MNRAKLIAPGLTVLIASAQPALAVSDKEIDARISEMAAKQGITDKNQLEALRNEVKSISRTIETFAMMHVKEPCAGDFERFCSARTATSDSLDCIKEHRDNVTQMCEEALRNEFGGKPMKEAQLYHGVLLPKGSTFFYDPSGNVLGAQASQEFDYKGIKYKAGQIRFHEEGLSFATLVEDQSIHGAKYKAEGIGPFFGKDGNIENATLAENAEFGSILYKSGTQVTFYPGRKVQTGVLARDAAIEGENHKAGTGVRFNEDGTLDKRF